MRNVAGARASGRGPGHYSPDRRWWWDAARARWFRTVGPEQVEVVAEENPDRSWASALANVFVPYGDVYVRFVARERGPVLRGRSPFYVGAPFPAARAGLDHIKAQGAWLDIQRARLADLEKQLAADGWEPSGRGQHWWSARYSRPGVDWETPADAYDRELAGEPAPPAPGRPPRRAPGPRRASTGARDSAFTRRPNR